MIKREWCLFIDLCLLNQSSLFVMQHINIEICYERIRTKWLIESIALFIKFAIHQASVICHPTAWKYHNEKSNICPNTAVPILTTGGAVLSSPTQPELSPPISVLWLGKNRLTCAVSNVLAPFVSKSPKINNLSVYKKTKIWRKYRSVKLAA